MRPDRLSASAALLVLALAGPWFARTHGQALPAAPDGSRAAAPGGDPAAPPIRVDAVVTDRQGRPLVDLKPSDFELQVNGVVRALSAVALHTPPAPGAPPPGTAAPARRPGTRVFAFVLDEFHVSPGLETERVRAAVTRFIDTRMRPTDLAVVLKPLDQVQTMSFTDDRQLLREAALSFNGRKGDFAPRSAFEEQFIGRAPETVAAARVQLVTVALNELAMRLGELDAERAAVVFVSSGFARSAPNRRASRIIDLQGLVRASSRFHFPVYAFSPAEAAPQDGEPGPAAATLQWLASQTGGSAALDGRAIEPGLDRMAGDLDAYYALTLPPGTADGRFHQIEVRVKRAGASVRVRPGYWAPLSSEVREWLRRTTPTSTAPRRALKRSSLIDVWIGVVPRAGSEREMVVTWEPAPRRPNPHRGQDAARVELAARAGGVTLFEGTLDAGSAPGVARFPVGPGVVELDMRVLGADGALLDTDVRDVPVADLSKGGTAIVLSPQVIRARTINEFRAAAQDPAAVPTNARIFSRTDRLLVRIPAWTAAGGPVEAGVRVLNRGGQVIRALEPSGDANGIPQFELPLYWLAPGEYYLEFTARAGAQQNRERIPIRITG